MRKVHKSHFLYILTYTQVERTITFQQKKQML